MISEEIEIIEVLNNVDNGIVQFVQEINNLGYRTVLSCSGMKEDHFEATTTRCPFICFGWPHLPGEEMLLFLRFMGDCLYNSNWEVQYYSQYIVGYLPWGLKDSKIKKRFQKFLLNLKNMDFFKHSR